jgi:peroxiredoxin
LFSIVAKIQKELRILPFNLKSMRKLLLLAILSPFMAMAQSKPASFEIKGSLKNMSQFADMAYLFYYTNGKSYTDSAKIVADEYSFKGTVAEPVQARIRVKYVAATAPKPAFVMGRDMYTFILEPATIKIVSTDSFSNVKVKGSESYKLFKELEAQSKPYNDNMQALSTQYGNYRKAKDTVNMNRVEKSLDSLSEVQQEEVYGAYLKKNPSSPIAMIAMQSYAGWDLNADKLEPIFNSFSSTVKNYPSAIAFKEDLETAKKCGIGKIAMDFTQNDTLGNPVTMSSFRGKYLLIDFWASWCGPCRAENPNVVRVFNKFKDKGFHILGVSLDREGQKDKWLKAIHDDKLEWTHVSDLKFWENAVSRQYGIKAIPQNLLLDPTGKIIGKNLRGEDLDKKLSEVFSAK